MRKEERVGREQCARRLRMEQTLLFFTASWESPVLMCAFPSLRLPGDCMLEPTFPYLVITSKALDMLDYADLF